MRNFKYILFLLSFMIGTAAVMAQTSGYETSMRKSYGGYVGQSSYGTPTYSTPFTPSSSVGSPRIGAGANPLGYSPALSSGSRYSPSMSAIGAHSLGINTPQPSIRREVGDDDNDDNSGFGDGDDDDEPEDRPKPYENPIGDAIWLLLLGAGWMGLRKTRRAKQ